MKTRKCLIGLTEAMVKDIDYYIKEGVYANRSDFLREAVRVRLYDLKLRLHDLET